MKKANNLVQSVHIFFCILLLQNGSVAKAIALWKRNLDKKFEGVEECYICFSVLHGTNLQLPKQQCKTCKKKFHSNCLVSMTTAVIIYLLFVIIYLLFIILRLIVIFPVLVFLMFFGATHHNKEFSIMITKTGELKIECINEKEDYLW